VPSTKGKILVIRGGAIGDFVCTLPAIAALRQQFPETHLELLGYTRTSQLALASNLVDQFHSIESRALATFFARGGPLPVDLAEYFASFGLILSYLYDPDEIFRTNIGICSKAQFLVGPHRPSETGSVHATDAFLRPLERLAIFDADPIPRLTFPGRSDPAAIAAASLIAAAQSRSKDSGAPLLALHPGSGSPRKNWPEANWFRLLDSLGKRQELRLLLVGGEAEEDRLTRLADAVQSPNLQIAQNLPLAELAQQLQSCTAFVGHDSGISHLAAAVGVSTLVLWGHTNASVWSPRGPNVELLQTAGGLAALEVGTVLQAIEKLLLRQG
jgi:heptosyltransferase-2